MEYYVCTINRYVDKRDDYSCHIEVYFGGWENMQAAISKYNRNAPEKKEAYDAGVYLEASRGLSTYEISSYKLKGNLNKLHSNLWDLFSGLSDIYEYQGKCGYRIFLDGKVVVNDNNWKTTEDEDEAERFIEKKEKEFYNNVEKIAKKLESQSTLVKESTNYFPY